MHTALDILKLNAASDGTQLIEANKSVAPELSRIPGFIIGVNSYTTVRRTAWPEGGFTKLGAGSASGKSQFENITVQCAEYKNFVEETDDRAKRHRRGVAAFLALSLSGAYQGALRLYGRTFYYGQRTNIGGGADACPGLLDLYDSANMTVDALGTTDNTCSSVWFVKVGSMEDGNVSFVFGNNNPLTNSPEWIQAMIVPDPVNEPTKKTRGWQNELTGSPGIQLADFSAVGRIKKLTEDAGKGLTDTLGYKMLEKFPASVKPDFAFMTRRSVRQLRDSRTNTGGGAPQIPWPTDIAGIPIVETDSITNTETLAL